MPITSVPNMLTLCIIPTHHTSLSAQPLFFAHTPGHYDSVVPVNDDRECSQDKKCKCYCGQKSDGISEKCLSFRCTCHRQSRGCHNDCKCKGYKNKYGIRPLPPTTRKRKNYDEQILQPLEGKNTHQFMTEKNEHMSKGCLTNFEDLLLKNIAIYCIIYGLSTTCSMSTSTM